MSARSCPPGLVALVDQLYAGTTSLLDDLVADVRRDLADQHDLDPAQAHATLTATIAVCKRHQPNTVAALLALALLALAECPEPGCGHANEVSG